MDTEEFSNEIESLIKQMKIDNGLKDCDIAWVLFQIANEYYFADICNRDLKKGAQ